jgi:hypothetical protein
MEHGDLLYFLIFLLSEGINLLKRLLQDRSESIDSSSVHLEDHTIERRSDTSLLEITDASEDILDRLSGSHTRLVWIVPCERSEDIIEDPRGSHTIDSSRISIFSEEVSISGEYLIAKTMERMDRHTIGIRADHASETITHIASRIVREGETEDIRWEIVGLFEDIGDTSPEYLRLATSRSCDHENRSVDSFDSFSLTRIE